MSSEEDSFSSCSSLSTVCSETESELIRSASTSSSSSSSFSSDSNSESVVSKLLMEVFENNNEITFVYDSQFIYTWMKPKLPQDNPEKIDKFNTYNIYPLTMFEKTPRLLLENYGSKVEFLFPPCSYTYYTGLPATEFEKTSKFFEPLTYEKVMEFENRCIL